MDSRKMVLMNRLAGQEQTCRRRKRTCGHSNGVGGGKLTDRVDIYTVLCIKLTASGRLLYNTGSSARCSVMT